MWFNQYPYINLTDLNLDFIYKSIRELRYQLENFININTIKYADPIQWNITTQYEANTVVIDANDGTAYLSTKPVPSGVALTNTDYWTPIFTLNLLSANQNITLRDDGSNVLATFASVEGDWLIWNNTLYKVSRPISVNEAYVVGYNLDRFSVELFIKEYINNVITMIGDLNDLTTTDKDSVVDAINELVTDISNALLDITNLQNDVSAINGKIANALVYNVRDYGATGDGVTDDTSAINDAIAAYNLTGGILYFPRGSYLVSAPFTAITSGGIIMGGRSTITATTLAASDILFDLTATAILTDFTIYGEDGTAIRMSTHCTVQNCTISKFDYQIIIKDAAVCTVKDNYLIYPKTSVLIQNDYNVDQGDHHIYGNTWSDPTAQGIAIQLNSGGGTYVNDNKFLNVAYAFVEAINSGATSVLNFESNSVECVVGLLFNSTQTGGVQYSNVNVMGNEFAVSNTAISIADNTSSVIINDNHFQGTGNNTALINLGTNGGTKYPRGVKIENNQFGSAAGAIFIMCDIPHLSMCGNSFGAAIKQPINANITQLSGDALIEIEDARELKTTAQTIYTMITSNDSIVKLKIRHVGSSSGDYAEVLIKCVSGTSTKTNIVAPTGVIGVNVSGRTITVVTTAATTNGDHLTIETEGNLLYINRNTIA